MLFMHKHRAGFYVFQKKKRWKKNRAHQRLPSGMISTVIYVCENHEEKNHCALAEGQKWSGDSLICYFVIWAKNIVIWFRLSNKLNSIDAGKIECACHSCASSQFFSHSGIFFFNKAPALCAFQRWQQKCDYDELFMWKSLVYWMKLRNARLIPSCSFCWCWLSTRDRKIDLNQSMVETVFFNPVTTWRHFHKHSATKL